ncbi:MAG: hypothetical protein APF76_18255 [Desulfitibacter sp. BRH_c19]|nr:MAG: hypothetical protein APF76_18255 [Desulfitibacter sp. BRH_c19]
MIARSTELKLPSGMTIKTPILVPSFSSKGFRANKHGLSEVNQPLKTTSEVLTESMLVSAYDLYYKHLIVETYPTDLVIVDSGGYETGESHDFSSVWRHNYEVRDWTEENLHEVLSSFPKHIDTVIVNFDHGALRRPITDQIQSAKEFFSCYPDRIYDFIIKPETENQQYIQMKDILKNIKNLSGFHIIGVTEKELGNSLLKRMVNIASIRRELDKEGLNSPIHVFGSLDPITSCLYFLAGAEIFDGLTWLRYSYLNGNAIYNQNFGAIAVGIQARDDKVLAKAIVDNIYYLQNLQLQMKNFLNEENFNVFKFNEDFFKEAYESLSAELGGMV